jgi:hypothetical protein
LHANAVRTDDVQNAWLRPMNQDPIVDADGSSRYVGDFSRRNHKRLIFAQH